MPSRLAARILPPFLAAYPDIRVEVTADDKLVDILAAGCDAGIRYEETIEKDMIAVPIGQREQRLALAASGAYLERHGRPTHPRKLLDHACLRGRFPNGALCPWEFERDGEVVKVDPTGPLVGSLGSAKRVSVRRSRITGIWTGTATRGSRGSPSPSRSR